MLAITLIAGTRESARLTVGSAGFEWFEYEAALAPTTDLRLVPSERPFPGRGTVSIRRGEDRTQAGERIVDSLRYIGTCVDQDTGESLQERFGLTVFLAPEVFDRLLDRVHWTLPELVLTFDAADAAARVVDPLRSAGPDSLAFHLDRGTWAQVASVTLTQRLRSGTH